MPLVGQLVHQRCVHPGPLVLGTDPLKFPSVHSDGGVWHLDVDSSHPGAGAGPKGSAVRRLKWYVSWVQNVVRQFGPYLLWVFET